MAEQRLFSSVLSEKVRIFRSPVDRAEASFWAQPNVRTLYPELLYRAYWLAAASVPLMEEARALAAATAPLDPVSGGLVSYLDQMIPGETGHETWILDDFEALGGARSKILERLPPAIVASNAGAQYYWIRHWDPVSILGYIAVLEADPPTVEVVESVVERTRLPRSAFSNELKHAALEPFHNDLLDRTLDSLPLTESQQSLIGVSAARTAYLVAETINEVVRLYGAEDSGGLGRVAEG